MPIRTRIFLNTLGILLLGMGLAAVLAWRAVENLYLDTQRENLLAQAKLSAAALQGQSLSAISQPYSQTSNVQPGIHTHLLDQQDAVVLAVPGNQDYSSWQDPISSLRYSEDYSPDSLMTRSEIISALKGEPATAVHRVDSRQVLYAAAPIYDQNGAIAGILYLAAPLPPSGLPLSFIAQMIAALGMAVLLALLAGALLSRRLARPLEEAARAAQAVAAGDLEQQLPAQNGIRELRSLEDSFNRMTASLRQSAQTKNAFIADVTHELRTPLTVIKGTIETLEDGALDDLEGRGPLLESMQRESERLIRLVNELLVLTRADAGALQMDIQPVDLAQLAGARCEGLGRVAEQRGVKLLLETREQAAVRGDPDRIAQILDNLLDNAIRHSPEKSTVKITIEKAGKEVRCAVSDQGTGIAAQHLPLIFERFYRADASRTRQTGGTGLGLAIVRALVTAQGGRVAVESAEGMGTTLTFWLPTAS